MTVTSVARRAYVGLSWLFLAGLVVQVFLAGLGLFSSDPRDIGAHIEFGYWLPLVPVAMLVVAALGRVGAGTLKWVGGLTILTVIQTILPTLASTAVFVAALHPVNALLLFWLAVRLAWGSRPLLTTGAAP